MIRFRWIFPCLLLCLLVMRLPVTAQDSTTRDPASLAQRFFGAPQGTFILEPAPLYQPGETHDFWVHKKGSDSPTKITALLFGAGQNVYIWVEEGLRFDPFVMETTTQFIDAAWNAMRTNLAMGHVTGFERRLPVPDIDNNDRLSVLFVTDLNDGRDVIYNANDSLPTFYTPGGFGNQHEVMLVNVSKYPTLPITDSFFANVVTRGMYRVMASIQSPDQPAWLTEALSWYFMEQLQAFGSNAASMTDFLGAPSASLIRTDNSSPTIGGQLLFLTYLQQRLGVNTFVEIFNQEGEGLAAIDNVLIANNLADPNTGQPVTARDLFADFVLTNMLNLPFGDGRYFYQTTAIEQGAQAAISGINDVSALNNDQFSLNDIFREQVGSSLAVNQFGSFYFGLGTTQPLLLDLTFFGSENTPRLPMPDTDRLNSFYWSGRGRNRDHTLTRTVDLSGVTSATLTFDAWYNLAEQWNYGYVAVSQDEGQSWEILPASTTTHANASGLAYGMGFTGISNPTPTRPRPYIGINYDANTGQITGIDLAGPIAQTEAQVGDVIIGYDGREWPNDIVDLVGLLANYAPGDTLNLYMARGDEHYDLTVVLGVHPSSVIAQQPLWLTQSVDLTPYAGKEILLRFEYISMPDAENDGFAIDNIAIPELGFSDDAETEGSLWTLVGWQRVTNQVPQRYLVQIAIFGADGAPIRTQQLIDSDDPANSGQWRFKLEANQNLIFAVSGLNENTLIPTTFDMIVTRQAAG
jgi:hypothetical protein